jgi:hypothetical protein
VNSPQVVHDTPEMYVQLIVDLRRAAKTRRSRWHAAIAIAAIAGVFIALIAGSSLRPRFSADTLPEPAAWSHKVVGATAHAQHEHSPSGAQFAHQRDSGSSRVSESTMNKRYKKPFHSMWMTQQYPSNWTPLSPQSFWQLLPMSFAFWQNGLTAQLVSHHGGAPPDGLADQDTLTELCVARR